MKWMDDKIDGAFVVEQDLDFHGLVNGSMTVASGRAVKMHGTVYGNMIVERGATAFVHGRVSHAVINQGGDVVIHGMVGSVRDIDPAYPTMIGATAMIVGHD